MVAQSRNNLCVWYNIDMPDKISMFQIKASTVHTRIIIASVKKIGGYLCKIALKFFCGMHR